MNAAPPSSSPAPDSRPPVAPRKGTFAFKNVAWTPQPSESGNPALVRFKEPAPPTLVERIRPLLKILAALAVTLVIITILVAILPLQTAEVRLSRLSDASRMLATLADSPEDHPSLQNIRGLGRTLRQEGSESGVANALMAVSALSQLNAGFVEEGLAACRYIQKEAAGSSAAEVVDARHFFSVCPSCKGSGTHAATPDQTMKGPSAPSVRRIETPSRCLRCEGTGQTLSKEQVKSQYLKSISEAQQAVRMSWANQQIVRAAIRLRKLSRRFLPAGG